MIELELLGANGDRVVMTDADGERYEIVVDDALRGAVRRARPTVLAPVPQPSRATVRPRDLQALMRAGASAQEVAASTGMDVEHIQRFEGPVLAERAWAVDQARSCRIGWGKDSPVLGDLVLDRLATRGVEPTSLSWDALRHGREPWHVLLTFIQGAEEKSARWELDLSARSVTALDDEARWLTEAATARRARVTSLSGSPHAGDALADVVFDQDAPLPAPPVSPQAGTHPGPHASVSPTEALLDSLTAARGQRVEPEAPEPTGALPVLPDDAADQILERSATPGQGRDATGQVGGSSARPGAVDDAPVEATDPADSQQQPAASSLMSGEPGTVVPLRRRTPVGHHPAGSGLAPGQTPTPVEQTGPAPLSRPTPSSATGAHPSFEEIVTGVTDVVARAKAAQPEEDHPSQPDQVTGSQPVLPTMPEAPQPRPKRRPRRSVPSWDEIVFGAKPE